MNKVIALAGNPNVGKSTIFNALTLMHQHTGNWPGKTVENAIGYYKYKNDTYKIVDLPGTYSLISSSKEEEIARDYLCFSKQDLVLVVCDATNLKRNLNLVLQILEIKKEVIVVVNLLDEARKKKIKIDLEELSNILGVPVVGCSARNNEGITTLKEKIKNYQESDTYKIKYSSYLESQIKKMEKYLNKWDLSKLNKRFISLRLLAKDDLIINKISKMINYDLTNDLDYLEIVDNLTENIEEEIIKTFLKISFSICDKVVRYDNLFWDKKDRLIDRVVTNKIGSFVVMGLFLVIIFWITIIGSNYISDFLFKVFEWFKYFLEGMINISPSINSFIFDGIYKVLTWVIAVMLPPMAIFFPMFTILEDYGYLPRIAFNLDKCFQCSHACGKQALTMCMGFGCNAVGVTGTRIIDSPRERLLAILTNNFVPCNGRFPMILAIISIFFTNLNKGILSSLMSAFILMLVIFLGIIMTFLVCKILSKTILKGLPSNFILELPSYRRPQFGKVIVRSLFDRTFFVLLRAVKIAIPAGAFIWLCANIKINSISLLSYFINFLEPFGKLIGLDGTIVIAFLLGFPANEIVIPVMLMGYLRGSTILEYSSLEVLKEILVANGWNIVTAICFVIIALMHFPCSTTILTIKKETNSAKWTFLSFLIPTVCGIILCLLVNLFAKIIFGL